VDRERDRKVKKLPGWWIFIFNKTWKTPEFAVKKYLAFTK